MKIFAPNILSPHIHSHQAMHLGQSGVLLRTWGIWCKHLGTTQIEKIQHHSPPSSKGKKLGPFECMLIPLAAKNFYDYLCPLTLLA
jgi:hypothetical protein